ncbi:MAG: tRNA modification GTPase, partial [Gammaproteobacteria bacterium]|nr:tRNA modification GTPase [Gammaproteobacteria bacterium]
MSESETIAAIATPPGRGGVCIIRASGPQCQAIARAVTGKVPQPRYASFCHFKDKQGQLIDEGLALYFPAPHSFTGEDVLELHGHGGIVVSDMILQSVLDAGARMARPGEFSERAFLNDKLDLAQTEAVVDLIDAGSRQAARAAVRTLDGEFSHHINELLQELIDLRIYVESSLDFADEEIEFIEAGDIEGRLIRLGDTIQQLSEVANRGRVLGEGLHIVIAGKPNAGKSSLMNALCGRDSAIVTEIPGTTRDVLRE